MASGGGGNGGKEGSNEKQMGEGSNVYSRKLSKGSEKGSKMTSSGIDKESQGDFGIPSLKDGNLLQKSGLVVDSGDSSSQSRPTGNRQLMRGNVIGKPGLQRLENRVTINLSMKSRKEVRELRTKLESELGEIQSWLKKIDSKVGPKAGNGRHGGDSVGKLKRAHSEIESVGSPRASKPLNQLSVSVVENSHGGSGKIDKEKQAPKVNNKAKKPKGNVQTSETKKLKSNAKKGRAGESDPSVGLQKFPNNLLKSCGSLLDRLMKHKSGWVFNVPVNPVALGLNDYFDIIKNPMDLGTVKSRLSKKWYESPHNFADDVRLTFQNAMTYNPKGHNVYMMAETLLKIFEDKWNVIEADYMRELRSHLDHGDGVDTPTSKKAPPSVRMPPPEMRNDLNRTEQNTHEVNQNAKALNSASVRSAAAPKKPKAKDPNKREMTYGEKQKLSEDLQSLPSEKLENVVHIIKKRNPSLSQNDDEIEVDIDNVDTETLWELDRFVTNYKKSLSKMKKQVEHGIQSRGTAEPTIEDKNPVPASVATSKETEIEAALQSQKGEKEDNGSRSTKENNGSSDLESSSGGSDSQSSSGIGSDV